MRLPPIGISRPWCLPGLRQSPLAYRAMLLAAALSFASALLAYGGNTWVNTFTGGQWNNPISSWLDTLNYNRTTALTISKGVKGQTNSSTAARAGGSLAPHVTYNPSSGVHSAEAIATAVSKKEDVRKDLCAFLKQAYQGYQADAARHGRKNDLGYAVSFFLVTNYLVVTRQEVPDDSLRTVARQIDKVLASQKGVADMTDAQRQAFSERLVMSALLAAFGSQQAKSDDVRQAFESLASSNLKTLGFEASRMTFDASGVKMN